MNLASETHHLLILSQDFEMYNHLITAEMLPGLSVLSTSDSDEAIRIGGECDLIFGEPSRVSQVINHLPNLRWAQTTWAGVEPLLASSMRRDYLLTNARNVYGTMMSEYVFGYLLLIERRILSRWQSQQIGKWDDATPGTLRGKLLGLLGVGTIGTHLAATGKHFNMRVYGFTRQSETCPDVDRYFHETDRDSFAKDLDYLVCTLPGTERTKNLVEANFLSSLPNKAWLINVGRGTTLDEIALSNVLSRGSIAGAVLDVFNEEPLPVGHPLWSMPNVFITSHTAARNYLPDIATLFITNYKRFINGKPLLYRVDFNQGY